MPKQHELPENQVLRLIEGNSVELVASDAEKPDGPRAFKMLAYSGAAVQRWFGRMVFDLSGIELSKKRTPILKNHDSEQIVGMSDSIEIGEAGLIISGKLSRKTIAAREVAELSDEGFPWQASIGMEISSVERLDADAKAIVNGREITGPAHIVRKSKLRESSFVPVGADGDTSGVVMSFFEKEELKMANEKTDLEAERKSAAEGERKRFADLSAKFPKHAQFVSEHFAAGTSVEQAEAAFKDVLLKEQAEEIAKLKAAPPAANPPGGAPPANFSGDPGKGAEKDFMQLAEEHRSQHKCDWNKALSAVALAHPKLHAEYVGGCRQSKPREVERAQSK